MSSSVIVTAKYVTPWISHEVMRTWSGQKIDQIQNPPRATVTLTFAPGSHEFALVELDRAVESIKAEILASIGGNA